MCMLRLLRFRGSLFCSLSLAYSFHIDENMFKEAVTQYNNKDPLSVPLCLTVSAESGGLSSPLSSTHLSTAG